MDPHNQDFLVVGAVEDADPTALGEPIRGAPQEIVVQFLAGGRLEREDLGPLRVHA
jgi:hypothetical protein